MSADNANTELVFRGKLEGHENWVTCIASGYSQSEKEDNPVLVSGSRDKSLIIWKIFDQDSLNENGLYGQAYRKLTGHSHFISDLALSNDNAYALSASWDKTLRLWNLANGTTARKFYGHTKEVYTCAFSPDNRQILSAGGDRQIVLWNTLGEKKYESDALNHQDWVSCVRYSSASKSTKSDQPLYFASVGWDGRLKIWNTTIQVRSTFMAHEHNINSVSISPNGKYIATGGKDQKLKIWKLSNLNEPERVFEAQSTIFQIAFNPQLQWITCATEAGVKVWNIMEQSPKPLSTLLPEVPQVEVKEGEVAKKAKIPMAVSVAWSSQGTRLFAGFTDGNINVWHVETQAQQ